MRVGPKKGVWNFEALKTPAFIEAGEFQTPFFGQSPGEVEKIVVPALQLRRTGATWPLFVKKWPSCRLANP